MNCKIEKRISDLKKELEETEQKLNDLGNERCIICSELNKLCSEYFQYIFDSWDIHVDDCVILLNKDTQGWILISGLHVTSIDKEKQTIGCVCFNYKDYRDEYKFEFCNKFISFSELEDIQKDNIVVKTTNEKYNNLILELADMKFTWANLNKIKDTLINSSQIQIISQ